MKKWLLSALVAWGIVTPTYVWSVEAEVGSTPERGIRFKTDPPPSGSDQLRYGAGLALFGILAGGAVILLYRRLPSLRSEMRRGTRLNVIERRMLGPRSHLYLIEVDGAVLVLAQFGDSAIQLDPSRQVATARGNPHG